MYNPNIVDKLPADALCKNDKIIIKVNLLNKLNDIKVNINSILYLTRQNIDIFNSSSDFYTDICYHYVSEIDKDIALRDRLLMYFPNISLCENGCEIIGVNLTTLQAICECSFNFLRDNIILSNNFFYQSLIG